MHFRFSLNCTYRIGWDHMQSFCFVPYLATTYVSQLGIFLGNFLFRPRVNNDHPQCLYFHNIPNRKEAGGQDHGGVHGDDHSRI